MRESISDTLELTNLPPGIFLVREGARHLTAHAFKGVGTEIRRDVLARIPETGRGRLRVAIHRSGVLGSATSLAALDRRFGGGAIVYDPTAIFTRASQIVRCAGMVRAALGKQAGKILFDSSRRTLYIVLAGSAFKGEGLVFRAQVAEAMATAAKTVAEWKKNAPADFEFAVRVGFEPPSGLRLVAVDEKSRPSRYAARIASAASRLRKVAGIAAVGAVTAAAPSLAFAGDDTAAVSSTNVTLLGQGVYDSGQVSHEDLTRFDGGIELAAPLGHSMGVQLDAGGGSRDYYGLGGHLFWRDPDWGMIGAVFSKESLEGITMQRMGGEAELYLDNVTLSARLGGQNGDVRAGTFGKLDVSFYMSPTFALRAGFEDAPHATFGHAGLEFQPAAESMPGLSLYLDGAAGEGTQIVAGIKFHFGEAGDTLMYRDRHEDPLPSIFNELPLIAAHHRSHYTHPV